VLLFRKVMIGGMLRGGKARSPGAQSGPLLFGSPLENATSCTAAALIRLLAF
jgi:hypothetical protein